MEFKKTIKALLLLAVFTHSSQTFSQSKILSPAEFKMVEDRIEKELANPKLDSATKFIINMKVGAEAYQYRFFDKAFRYYSNAIALKVENDKAEAYINRVAIAIVSEDKRKIRDNLNEAISYFEENKKFKTTEVELYLDSVKKSMSSEPQKAVSGFYGAYVREENLKNLLKDKKYQKAFSLFSEDGIKKSEDSFNVVVYDTLNILLNKKSVKHLYCDKEYKENLHAYVNSVLICGLLNDYLESGKFSDKKMKKAERYFLKTDAKNNFLLDMVKDIK